MFSLNLHFDVVLYKLKDGWEAYVSPEVGEKLYDETQGKSKSEALNKLLVSLKKKHPDVNIHLHLIEEPEY